MPAAADRRHQRVRDGRGREEPEEDTEHEREYPHLAEVDDRRRARRLLGVVRARAADPADPVLRRGDIGAGAPPDRDVVLDVVGALLRDRRASPRSARPRSSSRSGRSRCARSPEAAPSPTTCTRRNAGPTERRHRRGGGAVASWSARTRSRRRTRRHGRDTTRDPSSTSAPDTEHGVGIPPTGNRAVPGGPDRGADDARTRGRSRRTAGVSEPVSDAAAKFQTTPSAPEWTPRRRSRRGTSGIRRRR